MVEGKRKLSVGPDSSLSWVVAGASFLVSSLIGGLNRANGLLFARYVQQSGLNRELASWPFNIFGAVVFAAPLTGVLAQWMSARVIFILGIFMYSAGISICFVSIDISIMIAFFGIVRGIGVTLVVTLMPVFINQYFEVHRATAQGIASAGGAFGTVVFSYLIEFFLEEYSMRGSMLLIGGLSLHAMIGAMLMRSPPWLEGKKSVENPSPQPHSISSQTPLSALPLKKDDGSEDGVFRRVFLLVFDPTFIILVLSYVFSVNFSMIYVLVITDYAEDMHLPQSVLFLIIYSVGELFGRLCLGWITDRQLVGRRTYLVGSYILTGVVGGLLPFSRNMAVHMAGAAILGASQGSNLALSLVVLADSVQKVRLQLAVGLLRSFNGLGALTRSPIIGLFRDKLGSYDNLFRFLGCLEVFGALLWIALACCSVLCRRKQNVPPITPGLLNYRTSSSSGNTASPETKD